MASLLLQYPGNDAYAMEALIAELKRCPSVPCGDRDVTLTGLIKGRACPARGCPLASHARERLAKADLY